MGTALVAVLWLVVWLGAGASAQNAAQNQAAIFQLQEQVRQLNGRVEELTFQILELQELLRSTQEDNEGRFQDLEDASGTGFGDQGSLAPKDQTLNTDGDGSPVAATSAKRSNNSADGGEDAPAGGDQNLPTDLDLTAPKPGQPLPGVELGQPPRSLGTLTLDKQGNLVDSALGKPLDLTRLKDLQSNLSDPNAPIVQDESQAAAPSADAAANPGDAASGDGALPLDVPDNLPAPADLYQQGYDAVLAGNYGLAEEHFRNLIAAYPQSDRVPNTHYWLGESLFAQGDFNDAAERYLTVVNSYPESALAPDAMLKLG